MLPEPLGTLPAWLVVGLFLGGVLAVGVAVVFAVGVRLFPDESAPGTDRDGGERRRRAEIRDYLDDIGEPYREEYTVAGRPAPFYLPDRGVAITFDARDYFRFERAGVRAVLLEYEVPGGRIGGRLPFETPEPEGPARGDATSTTGNRWRRRAREHAEGRRSTTQGGGGVRGGQPRREAALAALGLPADASETAVRDAYRDRVKEVHPDHGGDVESFRRLREAYTVARERGE